MKGVLFAGAGAVLSVLAFPPFGYGFLIFFGVALFLAAIRTAESPRNGLFLGLLYGIAFWGGLMWWLIELHWTALLLAPVQALFTAALGWWLARFDHLEGTRWVLIAVGTWAIMEIFRYQIPVGGQEWGAVGYSLSRYGIARGFASSIGTTGVTVLAVCVGAVTALGLTRARPGRSPLLLLVPVAILLVANTFERFVDRSDGNGVSIAIVQGATPCPFGFCPPNQRLRTYEQHLALTRTIAPGSADLVVWPESSTGSNNADPILNPEVGAAIGAEARRIGAWILVGGDRHFSETHWLNVNVLINPDGVVVGEYQKQHGVPFGEFVPLRAFFTRLIPELHRVPRDMIPGDGAVVFDIGPPGIVGSYRLGSVISWEGGFSRYSREHVTLGANLMVVATNNDSYGPDAPTSLQFTGMTRMRAAELGVPVAHAAVTGRSVVIDRSGSFFTELSGLGTQEIVRASVVPSGPSLYARTGDVVMIGVALLGLLIWWRTRSTLVVSPVLVDEEE